MFRVLVVDDKEQDRYLLQILLQKSGYIVDVASDGEMALSIAKKSPPDLVISDILMPGMDGFCLCREWRRDPTLRLLPFIFYTATYTDPRDEEFALNLGADNFIAKPLEPAKLLEIIQEVFSWQKNQKIEAKNSYVDYDDGYYKKYSQVLVRKLEDKVELFSAIFNIDPSVIILLSPDKTVLEFNRAAASLFNSPAEDIIDKNFIDSFVSKSHHTLFLEQIEKVLSGNTVLEFEGNICLTDGTERVLEWNAQRIIRASDALEGILLIGNDITVKQAEARRTELETQLRLAQKMEALGIFSGGIAHDFNNILTGIIGFIDMAQQKMPVGTEESSYLHDALRATDRAKNLVAQLLSISRCTPETFKPIQITSIIKEACNLLRASIPHRIEIVLDLDENSGMVFCDPTQIHQVLLNLCTNAYHAIGESEGTISISCKVLNEDLAIRISNPKLLPGSNILITVADTGAGMSHSIMTRIFETYFTTKEPGKGTGLGLPVVKAIVSGHSGQIHFESVEGKGSTFYVFLPIYKTNEPLRDKIDIVKWEKCKNESILIVEDDEIIGPMLIHALTNLEYRATLASTGIQALTMFEQNPHSFDVVVTDLDIPELNGLALSRKINALRPETPIILMSGSLGEPEEQYIGFLGIRAILKKPFTIGPFTQVLKRVCSL